MYLSFIRVCPINMLKKCTNCDKHCFSCARVFLITILRDPLYFAHKHIYTRTAVVLQVARDD